MSPLPPSTKTAVDALARPKDDLFDNSTMTFGEHLEELRGALVKAIIWLMVGLAFGLLFANRVVQYIQAPLKQAIVEYNADRDMALMGLSEGDQYPDKTKLEEFHQFLMQNSLVAELVYALPPGDADPSDNTLESEGPDAAETLKPALPTDLESPGLDAAVLDASVPDSATLDSATTPERIQATQRVHTADLVAAIGQVPDPAKMVPTIQFRRSEKGVSSLKVEETFMIWVKAGLIVGAVLASPMIFYHLWSFVAAGLHTHERRYVYIYLPFSVILFAAGVTLAFFLVLHYVLNFLLAFNNSMDVAVEPRLSYYVNFVLMLPLGFGVAFQLPLVMLFLQRIGLIETEHYVSSWRVAVLVIFVISMVVTPADVTSMVALAIPLLILYFLGIGMCAYMPRGRGLGKGAYDPA
ncbi:sec-independent protein translocase protein TatC [Neorhodopirellula lusitana]|uniref:Sec-independent protein translocase protein TatC n=1 Tax=Neorhodopirellula lusitana TaxID=445327 RepID=A0ABY1PMQ1_9BACT|nr:sec-independent protein translocase protein TatC [Neorhodopirellula lusitana]